MRNAVQNLTQATTNSNYSSPPVTHPFITTIHLYPKFEQFFNKEAKAICNLQTNGMVHQYVESNHEWSHLHGLMELIALLGIKSAKHNPCEKFFDRKYAMVHCFGFSCEANKIDAATIELINNVNDMASNKFVNASLYNLGMMKLGKHDPADPDMYCVFSYLAVPHEHEATVKSKYSHLQFPEGGLPPRFK